MYKFIMLACLNMLIVHLNYGQEIKQKSNGWFSLVEGNYSPSVGTVEYGQYSYKPKEYYIGFSVINGYQLNEYFFTGIGVGWERLKNNIAIPVTADFKVAFSKKRVSPIIGLGLGMAFGLKGFTNNNIINPSIGIKVNSKNNNAFQFTIGFRTRTRHVSYISNPYSTYSPIGSTFTSHFTVNEEDVLYKYMTLKLGFMF